MAQGSIADSEANGRGAGVSGEVASRIRRGIALYSEVHQAIETQHRGIYRIPSSTGRGFYRVIIKQGESGASESCTCPDRKGHDLGMCKHITAALIHDAKRPTYRVRKTQGEQGQLFELLEKRAGIEEVIGWGTCSEMYWSKWALENPEWEVA